MNRELLSAIAVSIVSVFAIYVCFNASESVPNEVISLVVLAATGTSIYFWFLWWHHNWASRFGDMQEQINDLRMDLIQGHNDTDSGLPASAPRLKVVSDGGR